MKTGIQFHWKNIVIFGGLYFLIFKANCSQQKVHEWHPGLEDGPAVDVNVSEVPKAIESQPYGAKFKLPYRDIPSGEVIQPPDGGYYEPPKSREKPDKQKLRETKFSIA